MTQLQEVFTQLGVGGGLLFGLPLAVIGLALRGLAREKIARFRDARQHRRRIADISNEGPVTVAGRLRVAKDGQATLEEAVSARSVLLEVPTELSVKDGEAVLVFGTASRDSGASVGYREDARAWSIDARGDESMVLIGASSLGARIAQMRLQAFSGALTFAFGLAIVGACVTAAAVSAG